MAPRLLASCAALALLAACSSSDTLGNAGLPLGDGGRFVQDATDRDSASPSDASGADAAAPIDGALPAPTRTLVYVGADDSKIHVFALDRASATLTALAAYPAGNFPSFIAFDVARGRVFTTNENDGAVAAFALDTKTGALTPKNTVTAGAGTTHVSLDRTGAWILAANYGGASASVFPVNADGSLGAAAQTLATGANPHCALTSSANDFAFIVEKGADEIAEYAFDATSGQLTPNTVPHVATAAGAGPRHLVFHPSAAFAYVIAENASTVTTYAYDANAGTLSPVQTISTLAAGFTGTNTGAEVQVTASGRFVLASNRGDDSIVTFAVDPTSRTLAFASRASTGGKTPRHFSLDEPDGVALVANQDSGTIAVFHLDATTGALTPATTALVGAAPYYVQAIALPAP
jgi:6-phosphogluconolactonase